MPSKKKRIGYLPSSNAREIITKIADNEKLSQSKVVGLLVEEALIARGFVDLQKDNDFNSYSWIKKKINTIDSFKDHELDELISDKGITYNKKDFKINRKTPKNLLADSKENLI
tara:strand:+ start:184 stop:525 length:342 start_codon:yes stop_codon:yes gene_type:complete